MSKGGEEERWGGEGGARGERAATPKKPQLSTRPLKQTTDQTLSERTPSHTTVCMPLPSLTPPSLRALGRPAVETTNNQPKQQPSLPTA